MHNSESGELFFCLLPEPDAADFITACKNTGKSLCSRHRYMEDAPHLTLYAAWFSANREHDLCAIRFNFIHSMKNVSVRLGGWHRFNNDPLTGGTTLAVRIDQRDMTALGSIQQRVISTAAPLRHPELLPRYRNAAFSDPAVIKSLSECGFPFAGAHWFPHITVASFLGDNAEETVCRIERNAPPEKCKFTALALCRVMSRGFTVIKKWETGEP